MWKKWIKEQSYLQFIIICGTRNTIINHCVWTIFFSTCCILFNVCNNIIYVLLKIYFLAPLDNLSAFRITESRYCIFLRLHFFIESQKVYGDLDYYLFTLCVDSYCIILKKKKTYKLTIIKISYLMVWLIKWESAQLSVKTVA